MTQTAQIQSGSGNAKFAGVTDTTNQLLVRAEAISDIGTAARNAEAYSWTAVTADVNAGDTALLVANTSATRRLVITDIWAFSDVPTQLKIHVPAEATLAGTAVVGVPLNRTNTAAAPATAKADETGNTFAAANTILTLKTNELTTDQFGVHADLKGAVVLGENDSIAVDLIAETAAFECTIWGYYYTPEV